MALADSTKVDYLWKKIGYGVTKTDIPANKEAYNESIASPLLLRADKVLQQSADIPGVQPTTGNTSVVAIYNDSGNGAPTVECTEDITATDNRTWKTGLTDWVPPEFGSTYLVKVYVANVGESNPQTNGTQLFSAGSGNDDEWFFDYQSGVLNFNGANIPSVITTGITGKSVFVAGARYIGPFGVGGGNSIGNLTVSDTTIGTAVANADIILNPTGSGIVTIDTTTGFVLPVGNTAQRSSSPTQGEIRFNSATTDLEVYNGSSWETIGGSTANITQQEIVGDGSTLVFTLDQDATATSIIVSTNGILQLPDTAYTVTGNQITFAEAPISSDTIDIRFISELTTVNAIQNSVANAVVQALSNADTVQITGNLLPESNVTYNLGSTSLRWNELYLAGNTITLGSIVIKDTGSNTIGFFESDGSTPATLDANVEIVGDAIESGTSNVAFAGANGNVNIRSGGNLSLIVTDTGANVTGTFNATGNLTVGGNITSGGGTVNFGTGNIAVGNVSVTGIATVTGNITGGNLNTGAQVVATGNVTGGNLNTGAQVVATGNVTGGNLITAGLVSAGATVTATGNVVGGNLTTAGTITDGTLTISSGAVASGVSADFSGNVDGGNINSDAQVIATGNITGGNLITAGLASIGTTITATGNVTGGNLITAGLASVTGNVTGGNLITGGLVNATGNVTGSNLITGGLVNATGNVTGGNLITAGLASVTGNVTGGNLITGGLVNATGNITGGNISSSGTLTTSLATANTITINTLANVTSTTAATSTTTGSLRTAGGLGVAGNAYVGGLASVTGNVTGGNLITAGLASVTGNVTGGNLITAGLISAGSTITATGNVVGGNIRTAGIVGLNSGDGATALVNLGTDGVGNIGTSGQKFNTVFAKATSAEYADLAENFAVKNLVEPGTVMTLDGSGSLVPCEKYADPLLAGVISTDPAHLMNQNLPNSQPIALAGSVPCKVVGPVQIGDLLTTSAVVGHAEKLHTDSWIPGVIVGKALESASSGQQKIISIFVGSW